MIRVDQDFVNSYLQDDWIARAIKHEKNITKTIMFASQSWLESDPVKRSIFSEIYSSLLYSEKGLRVLDIGGGVSQFTHELSSRHYYSLTDLLAHDDQQIVQAALLEQGVEILVKDWLSLETENFDYVVCNDLLPNVDQRLSLFLEKFLPVSKNIILLLTWHNGNLFYATKRQDADELMFQSSWRGDQLLPVLRDFSQFIVDYDEEKIQKSVKSPFRNGRSACIVRFRGLQQA